MSETFGDLSGVELDHFLVEHTIEEASIVAAAINRRHYDVIYFELNTDPHNQVLHQEGLNMILRGVPVDRQNIPDRDYHLHVAAELNQPQAHAIVIDQDFGLKTVTPPGISLEEAFMKRVINAQHSTLREERMAEQITLDIAVNRIARNLGAIVTGALHTEVSEILAGQGAQVNQIFVGNAQNYGLDKRPDWNRFSGVTTAFVNNIEYALRHGADPDETRQAFFEVIARGRQS